MSSNSPNVQGSRLGGRIAIVGAGAIGLYYGSRLAANGEDVHFLLRGDYEAVSSGGIQVESVDGDMHLNEVNAHRSSSEIGKVDWVIITWKATSNDLFREVLDPLVGPHTRILTLQNGLGNCELLASLYGPERILGGLCFVCINRVGHGQVSHTAGGKITVGEWQPEPGLRRANLVVTAFKNADIPAALADDLRQAQWRKLVWNVPFNGLAIAEGGVTTDVLLENLETEKEIATLMGEVISGAAGFGLEIDQHVIEMELERTRPMGAYRPSSMIDYVEGRPVEYDAIWAEPIRQANEAGVPVPHMEELASRIRRRLEERESDAD